MSPKMLDFLPLGLGSAAMIILGFHKCAGFMRRAHVAEIIGTTQLKSPDVFGNPPFTRTINLSATQHADAAGFLPHLKPPVRCKLPTNCCP